AAAVDLSFLRSGQSNPNPQTFHDSIPPGATKVYENAAQTLFGISAGLGAVRVRSSRSVLISSRIYNQSDGQTVAGSQGLFSSGLPADFGIARGQSGVLQGVRQSADFRYNIFLVETTGEQVVLDLVVVDAAGNTLGTSTQTLGPWEHRVLNVSSIVPAVPD